MIDYKIIGNSNYLVGSDGSIFSNYINRKMKLKVMPNGYVQVRLKGHKERYVHRIVAEAFIEKPNDGLKYEVAHNDGSRSNNNYLNLRWATRSDNHMDKIQHGTALRGDTHNMRKLTSKDVIEIRKRVSNGEFQKSLAKEFNVGEMCISRAVRKINWGHIE